MGNYDAIYIYPNILYTSFVHVFQTMSGRTQIAMLSIEENYILSIKVLLWITTVTHLSSRPGISLLPSSVVGQVLARRSQGS